jgi:galactonate dehydratase
VRFPTRLLDPLAPRSPQLNRRQALSAAAAAAGTLAVGAPRLLRAREIAEANFPRLQITDIEVHPIQVPYHDWAAHVMNHFYGPTKRTIYVLHTNHGLTGLGESDDTMPPEALQRFIGTNPFDWINGDDAGLGFQAGLYDLMGKATGLPVYKLLGRKHRSWVEVAAWTVSASPAQMAATVKQLASMGYTWMKYHLSPFESITDQMAAMQEVAPKGFKIHLDFTMAGSNDHVFELLDNISKFPIAGCFEDPLPTPDIQGHAELRAKCRLPILYHHSPLGAGHEAEFRAADGYIMGSGSVGGQIRHAGLFAMLDIPFSMQCPGGMMLRAMAVHLHAAFKTSWLHFNTDTETWKTDVVNEKLEPAHGYVRVPEEPGLGLTLNREELERLKNLKLPPQPDWIIKSKFPDGTTMYNLASTASSIFMVRPDTRGQITLSYDGQISTEWWDPDGTPEFRKTMDLLLKEGMLLEKNGVVTGGGKKIDLSAED